MTPTRFFACLFVAIYFPIHAIASDTPEPSARYEITGVASEDTLNVRAQPGTDAEIVGTIEPNAANLVVTGLSWRIGESTWWELSFPKAERGVGWVNARFLARETDSIMAEDTNFPLACGGTEPFWSLTIEGSQAIFRLPLEDEQQTVDASPWMAVRGMRGWFVIRLANAADPGSAGGLLTVRRASQTACSDDMSDTDYPFYATVVLPDDQVFGGCCSRAAP